MTARRRPTVAVVGGGIAGLAAAWELVTAAEREGRPSPVVHVVESDDRTGGKLRSTPFAGRTVDLAADAFLARRPEATGLCEELGLGDQLVAPGAAGASIWARGRLRPMPDGLNLGVPTRWWPLARSGILSPAESLRVARDLVVPHRGPGPDAGDRSVGAIVGGRLGRPVVERLVDPLIGGINAGGVDHLSAAATMPVLIAAAHQPGSLMHRLGRVRSPGTPGIPGTTEPGPAFYSLTGGTADLAGQLTAALGARGVVFHTGRRVDAVERRPTRSGGARWQLSLYTTASDTTASDTTASGAAASGADASGAGAEDRSGTLDVDAVVLGVPAAEAAVLLAPHAPVAAGILSTVEYASVAVVTLSLPPGSVRAPMRGTGFLVPRTTELDGRPALVTGCTYLARKWPHLARADDELVRVSVGRDGDRRHHDLDDDELTARVVAELGRLVDLAGSPVLVDVTRWDRALPQYRVGHLIRVAQVEQEVGGLGGVAVAGAALRGVGIPACIGSGRTAGRSVLEFLAAGSGARGGLAGSPV